MLFCMSEMETKVLNPRKCEQQVYIVQLAASKLQHMDKQPFVNDNIDQACHNLPDKIVR